MLGHHGKELMLLKRDSKPANKGFKRKKLSVMGTYSEVKAKGPQMMQSTGKPQAPGPKMQQ